MRQVPGDDTGVVRLVPRPRRRNSKKFTQRATLGRDGCPSPRSTMSFASTVSLRRPSLTARHHGLPGMSSSGALSTPRACCHRMNATTARR